MYFIFDLYPVAVLIHCYSAMQYGVSEAAMVIFDFSKVGNKGL